MTKNTLKEILPADGAPGSKLASMYIINECQCSNIGLFIKNLLC
jgi:hypothetical protein